MYRKTLPIILASLPSITLADHLSGGFGLQSASPYWTESPQTLQAGKFSFGLRGEYQKLRAISDSELQALRRADAIQNPQFYENAQTGNEGDHERQANLHNVDELFGGSFRAAYGITDDLTVGFRLPYVYRSSITEAGHAHYHGNGSLGVHALENLGSSEGIGDMSFWGQYQFYKDAKNSAAVILGVKAPTGATTNTSRAGERLETHLQPGSGSWDSSYGLAHGYDLGVIRLNSSIMYTVTTKGSQNTDIGDAFNYNFAVTYPMHALAPCSACSWNLILEANGEWRDRELRDGDNYIHNSGGNTLYISPGVRFMSGQNWNIGTSFGYAVIHDLKGNQSEPDFRLGTAFNLNI